MQRSKATGAAYAWRLHSVPFVNWNDISEPGVYVDTEYPRYFRFPARGLRSGQSPLIHASDYSLARISGDPLLSRDLIRKLCADYGLPVAE